MDADYRLFDSQPLIDKSAPPVVQPADLSVFGRIEEAVELVPGDQPAYTLTYTIKKDWIDEQGQAQGDVPQTDSKILNYQLSAGDSIDDLIDKLNAQLKTKFTKADKPTIEAVRTDANHIGFRVSAKLVTGIDLKVERPGQKLGTLPSMSQIDLNGDRLHDLVIGAPAADVLGSGKDAGRVYVIQGSPGKADLPEDMVPTGK